MKKKYRKQQKFAQNKGPLPNSELNKNKKHIFKKRERGLYAKHNQTNQAHCHNIHVFENFLLKIEMKIILESKSDFSYCHGNKIPHTHTDPPMGSGV